jgi:serum/glucocorticoid-regulated kinase 2
MDEEDPSKFYITVHEKHIFEASSSDELTKIVHAMQSLGVYERGTASTSEESVPPESEPSEEPEIEPEEEEYPPGKRIGVSDFEKLKLVGKGSFAKVLQVKNKRNGHIYAMKVLDKAEIIRRKQVEHTLTEQAVLATLRHPFIVRLHYSFQTNRKLYLVLDYASGGELFFHLRKAGRFPEVLACFYTAEVVSALDYLHNRDIIYRDLKPENLILDARGHVMLTDFGLAKTGVTSVGGSAEGRGANTFCGTPEYLAPETIQGHLHGKAVDWWSVGVMLFEMLVGLPPFYAPNRNAMYEKAIHGKLIFPSYVTGEARNLLKGLLRRQPESRLGSGPSGAVQITEHPFFANIDWHRLVLREIPPPFKPRVLLDAEDISNFDTSFTNEPMRLSLQGDENEPDYPEDESEAVFARFRHLEVDAPQFSTIHPPASPTDS